MDRNAIMPPSRQRYSSIHHTVDKTFLTSSDHRIPPQNTSSMNWSEISGCVSSPHRLCSETFGIRTLIFPPLLAANAVGPPVLVKYLLPPTKFTNDPHEFSAVQQGEAERTGYKQLILGPCIRWSYLQPVSTRHKTNHCARSD